MHEIRTFRGPFWFLSNFAAARVIVHGIAFPSVEHAYVYSKLPDPIFAKQLLECSPGQAKRLGRGREFQRRAAGLRPWEDVREGIMLSLLEQKFSDSKLADLLLGTGDAVLIEGNYWGDGYWGVDERTGQGMNVLGKLLMRVRDQLREAR